MKIDNQEIVGKIVKIGTFDEMGDAVGWKAWGGPQGSPPTLELKRNGDVLVGGVLIEEWSQERRQKKYFKPIV